MHSLIGIKCEYNAEIFCNNLRHISFLYLFNFITFTIQQGREILAEIKRYTSENVSIIFVLIFKFFNKFLKSPN